MKLVADDKKNKEQTPVVTKKIEKTVKEDKEADIKEILKN